MKKMLELAPGLNLPADEAIAQKFGFIGRSGSGKSYAAMKLAELFLSIGAQVIALDWVGLWWSLRLAANGKAPGFEHVYIFGGEHADVPLEPTSGALMADLVVDKHISVVLDVMHFRKAERTRFATAFAEQFFHRKKTARTACHLFIEEAQAYLPQMVRGEEARMVGVFEDIGKVGRNYGIGNSLISQRPQAINKDVLNQIEVLLAFQTNGPQERKAIAGWTAENTTAGAAMMQALPTLPVGHALVWSPQWLRIAERVHILPRQTYNASATPTGKAKQIAPQTLAPAELESLGDAIKATVERSKADDPRELRKQIAELKKQLATPATPTAAPAAPKVIEKPVVTDKQIAAVQKLVDQLDALASKADDLSDRCVSAAAALRADLAKAIQQPPPKPQPSTAGRLVEPTITRMHATPLQPIVKRAAPSDGNGVALGKAERAILTVLAQHPDGCEKGKLTLLAGYRYSGGFRNSLGALRTAGYIVGSNESTMRITDAGVAALGEFDPLPTGDALRDYWLSHPSFGKAERAILAALFEHPDGLDAPALCQRTGYEYSGGFRNSLGALRTAGLLVGANTGVMKASDVLLE